MKNMKQYVLSMFFLDKKFIVNWCCYDHRGGTQIADIIKKICFNIFHVFNNTKKCLITNKKVDLISIPTENSFADHHT